MTKILEIHRFMTDSYPIGDCIVPEENSRRVRPSNKMTRRASQDFRHLYTLSFIQYTMQADLQRTFKKALIILTSVSRDRNLYIPAGLCIPPPNLMLISFKQNRPRPIMWDNVGYWGYNKKLYTRYFICKSGKRMRNFHINARYSWKFRGLYVKHTWTLKTVRLRTYFSWWKYVFLRKQRSSCEWISTFPKLEAHST